MDEHNPRPYTGGGTTRKHMGVATSDPEYLAPVAQPAGKASGPRGSSVPAPAHPPKRAEAPGEHPNYSRYLSTPKKGKAIFTSRQQRQRRKIKVLLALLIVLSCALALFWYFVLR